MHHFISTRELSFASIYRILETAQALQTKQTRTIQHGWFAANLFFEPSTRTKTSFQVAERKLGMDALDFHMESSSVAKGESLYDTARTYEAIGADLLVVRHASDHWYDELAGISIPIINAGAGKGEHPTQAILDLLTIYQEFGSFNDLTVVIAGDIKHSRVARSNAYALLTLGANVFFAATPGFEDYSFDVPYISMDEAVEMCDVLMMLRVQHERHKSTYQTKSYLHDYGLTMERERKMQDHAIVLHPAPVNRGVEIDTRLVECKRSRIFRQMENGVYARMAILLSLLNGKDAVYENFTKERQTIAT
ncbi:aspartate carbamoyltransferase [Lentibacillus persicus]|uniref:Aspartate carbamoyltransferase n=1 Tax=Lentibacillus persicus TaxID=640948 RepID=A0A1I1VNK1_9BACI|nr:aspartate carbamoyltransferase catalytic subunit [Lentibacillus persicus]SFD82100.1 aspartate carbamoyltransferase [Lentibacillus persicus]